MREDEISDRTSLAYPYLHEYKSESLKGFHVQGASGHFVGQHHYLVNVSRNYVGAYGD